MKKSNEQIPKWAQLILRIALFGDREMSLLSELEREFYEISAQEGEKPARTWYRRQLIRSLPSIMKESLIWRTHMFRNYLKIAIRHIIKHKVYSFLNVAGLTIGITCFLLITLMLRYEFSYDDNHVNAERIYRLDVSQALKNNEFLVSNSPFPLGRTVREQIPEVVSATRLFRARSNRLTYNNKTYNEGIIYIADPEIFSVFTLPLKLGNKETALKDKYSLVISEEKAKRYFGNENPIGKVLQWDNSVNVTVTGVLENFPDNTHIRPDIIAHADILGEFGANSYYTNWISQNTANFVLLDAAADPKEVEKKINSVFKSRIPEHDERVIKMEQLSRMHLYSPASRFGDIRYIYIFSLTGVLILVISCINFMNLSTARAANRSKEVGLRKVSGATRNQLINQFLGESFILSLISAGAALLLVYLLLPAFRNLSEQSLQFSSLFTRVGTAGLISIILFTGFFAGLYPAFSLSAFRIVRILKGAVSSGAKSAVFRRILVVFQFTMSVILITCTFIVGKQLDFMRNTDVGFDRDQMIIIPVFYGDLQHNPGPFKEELLKQQGIVSVATSMVLPHRIGFYNNVSWEGAQDGEKTEINFNRIGYDFVKTYNIDIIAGRNFSPEYTSDLGDSANNIAGGILINETAAKRFGWTEPVGKKVINVYGENRSVYSVVGVFRDFHFSSLRNRIRPLCLFLSPATVNNISIKIDKTNISAAIENVRATYIRMYPGIDFEYYFLDEQFDTMYRFEQKMKTIFGYFSVLAIIISCLGLFGLASFSAQQRTKEIGVRKVLGAPFGSIIYLVTREFALYVLIANIIAVPVVMFFMNKWLGDFAYRISPGAGSFLLAGILAFVIAGFTVSFHAVRAALSDPVKSLKYE